MNRELKNRFRELSHNSILFSRMYQIASDFKTKRMQSISDEKYLRKLFKESTGKELNLENPQTFCEKLQWLKLYDRNPLYTTLVDKYAAKKWVAERIGEEYVIPVVGGPWKTAEEINQDALPDQFVLKCNHDCGSILICKDKENFDFAYARKKLNSCLKKNYYWGSREWPYKNVNKNVFAEQFMEDEAADTLIDYKFYCFNGIPKFLYVCIANIQNGRRLNGDLLSFLDLEWKPTPFYRTDHSPFPLSLQKPVCFDTMIQIAEKLSKDIPFVRVDLYCINNHVYFSELTFSPGGGFGVFSPPEWEKTLGDWIALPKM